MSTLNASIQAAPASLAPDNFIFTVSVAGMVSATLSPANCQIDIGYKATGGAPTTRADLTSVDTETPLSFTSLQVLWNSLLQDLATTYTFTGKTSCPALSAGAGDHAWVILTDKSNESGTAPVLHAVDLGVI